MRGEVETTVAGERPLIETALPAGWERSLATCGLMLANAVQAADALIANVALPQLQRDLGGGIELGAWVITSYLCATAVMAPLTGWLRRRFGARRLFPGAVAGFAGASLLCALAPSIGAIILFRVLQGAAGGVIHPLSQAILLDIYPRTKHARMLALLGAGVMVGPILGPPLGGLITDLASWRWVFAINLPLGLVSVLCVARLQSSVETARDASIDVFGIPLLMAGVAALELALQRGVARAWFQSPEITGEAIIAVAAFALIFLRARRAGLRVFRPEVFGDINFLTASFYNLMLSGTLFVTIVLLPSLGEGPLKFPATVAGSMIVPRAVLMTLVILLVGRLIGTVSHRSLLVTGWVLMAAGLALLSAIGPSHALAWIIAGSMVQALGAGMLYTPLTTLAFSTLAPGIRTDATGLYSLLRQLGYASGVALMTAVLQAKIALHVGALPAIAAAAPNKAELVAAATLRGYTDCFRMMAVVAAVIIPGVFLFRAPSLGQDQPSPD